jgi:GxxExxY protein
MCHRDTEAQRENKDKELKMNWEEGYVDEEMEPNPELNRITNAIIGSAIAVHRVLGPGHLESAYEKAMAIEFNHRGIRFQQQVPVNLIYRGEVVGEGRLDFLVEDKVVLDLKSVQKVADVFKAQMISYLKMTKLKLGIILNFDVALLRHGISRIAN